MDRRAKKAEAGFSLIEVLVSLTILAIGLLGLALLQTTAIKGNAIASKSTVAVQVGQDKLEWFRRQAWSSIATQTDVMPFGGDIPGCTVPVYGSLLTGSAGDNVSVSGATYYRVWRVVTSGGLKTITVWTCWQDDRQAWHNVMLAADRADI